MTATNIINFYFIRHAESLANIDTRNVIGGQNLLVDLSPLGKRQAVALGEKLEEEGVKFIAVYTSTALRTKETANLVLDILEYTGPVEATSQLLEQSAGGWEGKSRNIYQRPDVKAALDQDNWNYVPGDDEPGESKHQVAMRMIDWLNDTLDHFRQFPGNWNIAVFSHGLAIKFLFALLLNYPRNTAYKIPIDNTSVSQLRYVNGKLIHQVSRFNDISHLSLIE